MYASPAYGTHQFFSEPGLDHLYESINDNIEENTAAEPFDDAVMEKSTEFNNGPENEIDSQKMGKSDEPTAQIYTCSITQDHLRMVGEQLDLENENLITEAHNDDENSQSDTDYVNDDKDTAPYLRVLLTTDAQEGDIDFSTAGIEKNDP